MVPPGQVSPKVARRGWVAQQEQVPSDNVIRQGAGGPLTFTRALEMSDSLASERARANGSVRQQGEDVADNRESVYDMNYEISV